LDTVKRRKKAQSLSIDLHNFAILSKKAVLCSGQPFAMERKIINGRTSEKIPDYFI
jgi:hypothetical protein